MLRILSACRAARSAFSMSPSLRQNVAPMLGALPIEWLDPHTKGGLIGDIAQRGGLIGDIAQRMVNQDRLASDLHKPLHRKQFLSSGWKETGEERR